MINFEGEFLFFNKYIKDCWGINYIYIIHAIEPEQSWTEKIAAGPAHWTIVGLMLLVVSLTGAGLQSLREYLSRNLQTPAGSPAPARSSVELSRFQP